MASSVTGTWRSGEGTFSGTGRGYELTLIEAEALESLAADGVEISWEAARRNVVTRGIRLNALVGRRFLIGEVECVGRRLAEPCSHFSGWRLPGILRGLVHRGGLRADILGERHDPGWRSCGADSGRQARTEGRRQDEFCRRRPFPL